MDLKIINYECKFCKHTWIRKYPPKTVPKQEVECPNCKKTGKFTKPYNFFKEKQNEESNV